MGDSSERDRLPFHPSEMSEQELKDEMEWLSHFIEPPEDEQGRQALWWTIQYGELSDELFKRQSEKREKRMICLTRWIAIMTGTILGLTALNVYLVWISTSAG